MYRVNDKGLVKVHRAELSEHACRRHGVNTEARNLTRRTTLAALSISSALVLTSCAGGSSSHDATANGGSTPTRSGLALQVRQTSLGPVLADRQGMTVYLLTSDKPHRSLCDAQCLTYWPAVPAPKSTGQLPGISATVATTKSTAGKPMATAGGWPLYTFVNDHAPGDVTGEGMKSFGGVWYAVSPTGQPVRSAPSASTSSTSSGSSGGGGY
jgi:predicted lipoprotein with Yx(FWY)xxD motif